MSGVVLAAVVIGGAVVKHDAEEDASNAQEEAIRKRMVEERIKADQTSVARDRQIENLVGQQIAAEAASGFEVSSPSFQAITMDDFNLFAETRTNDALEFDDKEQQLQADMDQTKIKANAQMWGDVAGTVTNVISGSGGLKGSTFKNTALFDDAKAEALNKRTTGGGLFDNIGV